MKGVKTLKRILSIVMISVTLSACGAPTQEVIDERFSGGSSISGIRVIADNETGCKYLFMKHGNSGGLSPLYKENGEIDCGK